MLSEATIRRECRKLGLEAEGAKHVLIGRLGSRIRDQERKMLTMGSTQGQVTHDVTPIHKVSRL